jgi:outer membrane protein
MTKRIFSIIILLWSSQMAYSQAVNGDLKTLINQSFSYFPQFKELDQALDVAGKQIDLAKSAGLPSIEADGNYRYTNPVSEINIANGDQSLHFQIMPNNSYSTMLNARYTLLDFGTVKANVARAKVALQYANTNIAYNQSQMAFQVASLYYQIAYIKKAIAIQDSVIAFLAANKKDTEIKLKNGDAIKYDVLSIQSGIDLENNHKIDLQNSLDKQYALMEYTTGMKWTSSPADFNFPLVSQGNPDQTLESAQEKNPEFLLLKNRIDMAEADLKQSKTGGRPSLSLLAGTGYANGYTPEIDKARYTYNAGVTLSIPIYQGGRAKKQVSLSQSQLQQTKLSEESLNNTYKKDIEQTLIDIKSNASSLLNSAAQIKEAKEAQKLAQSRFRNGIGTNLELTNASTNVQRALLRNLQYEYQLCQAELTLAKLSGVKYW